MSTCTKTKLDLNKVEYKNGKFYYENKKFPKGTGIGSGATAEVKRFTLPNVGSFVVKIFKRKDDLVYEIALLEYMKKFNCNIIESRVIKGGNSFFGNDYIFLLFENMIGDLEVVKGKLIPDKVIEIIKDIVEQIKCLSKINLYYTDIKLANVLFAENNGKFKILLGDLGSLAVGSESSKEIKKTMKSLNISEEDIDSSFTSVSTYPPPESCKTGRFQGHINNCGPEAGSDQVACIAAILWGLGVLALSLMFSVGARDTRGREKFTWLSFKNICDYKEAEINEKISNLIDEAKQYKLYALPPLVKTKFVKWIETCLLFDSNERMKAWDMVI